MTALRKTKSLASAMFSLAVATGPAGVISLAKKIVLRFLVLLDCAINWALGGKITETMSSRAYRMREKPQSHGRWLADAIDLIFFWQDDHCKTSHDREVAHGGALHWLRTWRPEMLE